MIKSSKASGITLEDVKIETAFEFKVKDLIITASAVIGIDKELNTRICGGINFLSVHNTTHDLLNENIDDDIINTINDVYEISILSLAFSLLESVDIKLFESNTGLTFNTKGLYNTENGNGFKIIDYAFCGCGVEFDVRQQIDSKFDMCTSYGGAINFTGGEISNMKLQRIDKCIYFYDRTIDDSIGFDKFIKDYKKIFNITDNFVDKIFTSEYEYLDTIHPYIQELTLKQLVDCDTITVN
jgi:hypothetical protein